MQKDITKDLANKIIAEYNKGFDIDEIAANLNISLIRVNKILKHNENGILEVKTAIDGSAGIQREEIEAFRNSLKIGQEFIYKPLNIFKGKPIYVKVKEVYPNFIYTEDNKSVLFPEIMVATGWLAEYRRKQFSKMNTE